MAKAYAADADADGDVAQQSKASRTSSCGRRYADGADHFDLKARAAEEARRWSIHRQTNDCVDNDNDNDDDAEDDRSESIPDEQFASAQSTPYIGRYMLMLMRSDVMSLSCDQSRLSCSS